MLPADTDLELVWRGEEEEEEEVLVMKEELGNKEYKMRGRRMGGKRHIRKEYNNR